MATLREAFEAARGGDLDHGAELARRAREERPGFLDPLFLLAAIDERRGDFEAARASYRQVLVEDPTASRAAVALAQTFVAEHREPEAADWLAKAIEEDPGCEPAAFNLGSLCESRGALDEAAAWFELSAALDARDPRSPVHVARIRLAQGRVPEARAAAEEAVRRDPDYVAARRVLAATESPPGDPR